MNTTAVACICAIVGYFLGLIFNQREVIAAQKGEITAHKDHIETLKNFVFDEDEPPEDDPEGEDAPEIKLQITHTAKGSVLPLKKTG
jgi:hypothetical protein